MIDKAPQILLLFLLNIAVGPNQHNYKKQSYLPLQPMNVSFLFFSLHGEKHSQTMENALQFTNLLLIKTKQWLATTDLSTKHNTIQKHSLLTQMAPKSSFSTDFTKSDQQQQDITRKEKSSTKNLVLGAQLKFMIQSLQNL